MRYRKRPEPPREVEAWQWKGQPEKEWPEWLGPPRVMLPNLEHGWYFIRQPAEISDRAHAVPQRDFEREYEPILKSVA